MREYRVTSLKMQSMGVVTLTQQSLESVLNHFATDGWVFDKVVETRSQFFRRGIALIVFYRDRP